MSKNLLLLLFWVCPLFLAGQKITLSGYLTDAETGETLIGASVYLAENPAQGTTTNTYGFYSLSIDAGTYTLVYSYLGYQEKRVERSLQEDIRLNIELGQGVQLDEVVVTAEEKDQNVSGTEMGTVELPVQKIKKLPALLGEVDVLKTIQLLPGVSSAGEGNAGFYVRGGGADQNLILLDEAVVFNSGHMLGFFSVFNADAIKNTTLIKGGIPARYGGRLSSVVDVQMKEGNNSDYQVEGGIGIVSSRLTVQGPILKNDPERPESDASSFIVSARRTYLLDLAQPFLKGSDFEGTNYYFYDLNTKFNYRFSDQDRIFLSTYFGRDVLKFRNPERDFFFDLPYGNATGTLRWNHLFTDKLFMNTSVIYNDYQFEFGGGQDDFSVNVFSGIRDWNVKLDFDYYPSQGHEVKFGANYTYHKLTPSVADAESGDESFSNDKEPTYANEMAIYAEDNIRLSNRLRMNIGLRLAGFTQLGPYTSLEDGTVYDKREGVQDYWRVEPRFSMRYTLSSRSSLKAGYTVTNQFIHLVSNSTNTLPADVWVSSTERVKPQGGTQYSLGYFQNFRNNGIEASAELYYKDLRNQIDYRENYVNNPADDLEQEFVFGDGRSYGLELFVRKNEGKFTGWIGYTLSRTEREFPDINNGEVYPAQYDRTHDLSVVGNYAFNEQWELGGVFVYGTGSAFTPLKSLYLIDQQLVTEYGTRNSIRQDDYHRLDLSLTYTPAKQENRRFQSSWNFSVYNIYSRFNPFFTYYDLSTDQEAGTASASAYKVSLFPAIPSVTWNFKWK